jgi:hypothetical protein
MKPILIFFTVLSFYAPNTEAINIFKYLLCGGRPDAYKTQKILPVNFDIDQGTAPNSSPMSSESISIDHWDSKKQGSEEIQLQHEEKGQEQVQYFPFKIKSVRKNKKKFFENELLDIDPPQDTTKKSKPTKTALGQNAKKINDFLGPNGVEINLTNLSEESARELLKIKRHMENVLKIENRSDLIVLRLEKGHSLDSIKFYTGDGDFFGSIHEFNEFMDEELITVETLNEFLKIVVNFYKDFGFDEILSDCIKVILDSGVITLDMLPEWFDMSLDQIFQMACTKRLDDLAKKLVLNRETASKLNFYQGLVKVFDEGNKELFYELLHIIKTRYRKRFGSVYNKVCCNLNLNLNMDEFEEYE